MAPQSTPRAPSRSVPARPERCPECGAPARPATCAELFDAVLALDHSRRPPWGPLHGVTVACYLLQHPGRAPADRDRPLALLRAYLDGGAAAAARFTEGARRANAHRGPGSPAPSRPQAAGKAPDGPRAAFAVTIADVAADGTFPADGFAERVTAWAEATAAAWRAPATHPR